MLKVETSDEPRQFHGITKSNDIEEHAGARVAVDAVDGCHGCTHALLRCTDDDGDDIIRLRRSRGSLCSEPEVLPVI